MYFSIITMIGAIKRVDRSIVIFILFLGLVEYIFGDTTEPRYCQTQDCRSTAKDFDKLIDWNASFCTDFYQFACGKGPPEKLTMYRTQEQYLSDMIVNNDPREKAILSLEPSSSDSPLLQLIKRYSRNCINQGALNVAGLKPIIKLLNKASALNTWWKLENWAVSIGLNSSLFSVKIESHMNREDRKGAIILGPPNTTMYPKNYLSLSLRVIGKMTEEGMHLSLAHKLRKGLVKELDFYEIVQHPRLAERNKYGERNLTSLSNWHDLWNKFRKHPQQMNWEHYLNNYWKRSVTSNVVVPLLKNGMFKIWIEYPPFIETLGRQVELFKDEDMQNIILWRIVKQLIQYAGKDTRNILDLPLVDVRSCITPAMTDELQKNGWFKIYPKPLRSQIRKMYGNVDLQMKLINYKMIKKILPSNEPLTPRERKKHDDLYRTCGELEMIVSVLHTQYNRAQLELKNITELTWPLCVSVDNNVNCVIAIIEYFSSKSRISKVKEWLTFLVLELSSKQAGHFQCLERVKRYEEEIAGRPYIYSNGFTSKQVALRNYVRNKEYPAKFPYQNTFTQPTLIIEAPAKNETYVDLALGLKRWERGMLLRETESFQLGNDGETFIINTISQDTFARFKSNRASSLNYGALGPIIGAQLWRKFYSFERDGFQKMETCVAQGYRRGKAPNVVYDTISDIFQVSNMRYGLQAAWKGFKRTTAMNDERDVRLIKDTNAKDEKISKLNDEKLFFLSFANANCANEPDNASKFFVNTVLGITTEFNEVFSCSRFSMGYRPDICVPNVSQS